MAPSQKVLFVDAQSGFYRMRRFPLGDFFGPVDLGLHLAVDFWYDMHKGVHESLSEFT